MANIVADAVPSRSGADSVIPSLDPYEVAYLRGGAREVLKLRLFELMQTGYLVVAEKKRWSGTERWLTVALDAPSRRDLPNPDKTLLASFETPKAAKEIFKLRFPSQLEDACRDFRQDLWRRGLLKGGLAPESRTFRYISLTWGLLFFLAFFAIPAVTHSTVAAVAVVIAGILGFVVLNSALAYHASAAGRQHLRILESQYAEYSKYDSAKWGPTPSTTQLAAVAVFGFGILQGSPADALATLLGTESKGGVQYGVESGGGCSGCGGCGGCGG